jgi:hypothetical protein
MMLQSESQPQLEAALQIVCSVWDKTVNIKERNALLLGLLKSTKQRDYSDWCIAVLRLACYPTLVGVQRTANSRWSETLSAFSQAIDDIDLETEANANIRTRLETRTLANARAERRTDQAQQNLGAAFEKEVATSCLGAVLSGENADLLSDITEEVAREILHYYARKKNPRLKEHDIEPLLKKLFRNQERLTPTERQRKSRALRRFGPEQAVTNLKLPTTLRRDVPSKKGTR